MSHTYDIAVIGLGAMGSAALYELAKRGVRAIGIERFELGHERGSSHGESRAIRLSYFEHPSYVPLGRTAFEKWRALERACGETVLTANGILEMGPPGSVIVGGSLRAALLHDLEHITLDSESIARRYPAFRLPSDWIGLYQPHGGFVRPEVAIRNFVDQARRHGGEVRTSTRVLDILPKAGAITIRTEAGTIEAGGVILATGAWMGEFASELTSFLTLTRQVVGWFEPRDPSLFTPERFPTFLLDTEGDSYYGFPDFMRTGVKVGAHPDRGFLASADALVQDAGEAEEADLRRMMARCIPQANGALLKMRSCIYTRTPDEDFVVDRSAIDPRVVLASPCSGHGFKFASALGEVLADLALDGRTAHDISRFRLDRFARQRPETMTAV